MGWAIWQYKEMCLTSEILPLTEKTRRAAEHRNVRIFYVLNMCTNTGTRGLI